MQDRIIFREMLSEIKELADEKGNRLTVDEIREFFAHAQLEEAQLQMIYDYLISQKIHVDGYEAKKDTEPEAMEEAAGEITEDEYVKMYLADLEAIAPVTDEEEQKLFELAAMGDAAAKSKLVELHLKTVYEIAHTYLYSDLPMSDLIQEGNVALMLAMEELELLDDLDGYHRGLFEAITKAMEEALVEQKDLKDMDEEIADRVNHLSEAVHNLEEDLEHKVSVEELSAYLEMPVEEIRDILRMAGDEIEVEVPKE